MSISRRCMLGTLLLTPVVAVKGVNDVVVSQEHQAEAIKAKMRGDTSAEIFQRTKAGEAEKSVVHDIMGLSTLSFVGIVAMITDELTRANSKVNKQTETTLEGR